MLPSATMVHHLAAYRQKLLCGFKSDLLPGIGRLVQHGSFEGVLLQRVVDFKAAWVAQQVWSGGSGSLLVASNPERTACRLDCMVRFHATPMNSVMTIAKGAEVDPTVLKRNNSQFTERHNIRAHPHLNKHSSPDS